MNLLLKLAGYRTYISHGAQVLIALGAVLTTLATVTGGIDLGNGVALGAVLIALAQLANGLGGIFQRMATKSLQDVLGTLPDDAMAVQSLVNQLLAALNNAKQPTLPDIPDRPASSTGALLFAFLALGAGVAMAEQPRAVISGPKTAEAGEEIILDLTQSEGEPTLFKWTVSPELKGRKQLTPLEGGKRVRLASFPGEYYVTGMIANADGIDAHTYLVKIPGSVPCPPVPMPNPVPNPSPDPAPNPVPVPTPTPLPTPTPTPTPTPVPPMPPLPDNLPAGEFDGLPAAVKALALSVNSPNRAAEAVKLANALEALAARVSAGSVTLTGVTKELGDAFNSSVPLSWDHDFRAKAIDRMKALFAAGKLSTMDRWAVMLREVVIGLRAVK